MGLFRSNGAMILTPAFTENVGDYSCAGPPIFAPYITPKLSSSFQWQYVYIPWRDGITFWHIHQGEISGGNTHICKQSAYLINFQPMCAILWLLLSINFISTASKFIPGPKLHRLHPWSVGMNKKLHPTFYNGWNYLSMVALLNCVSKRGFRWQIRHGFYAGHNYPLQS